MISTFEQRSPLTVLELYAKIDVAGSSFLPVARSIHFAIACGDHYSANVYLSDKDEDYIRDISSDENEDDDEGKIPDGDSSESEAKLDSPTITVSPVASSFHVREQLLQ